MGVYQKYKSNRIWNVDFRSGSFIDRSGNIVFAKTGILKKGALNTRGANYITKTGANINQENITLLFSIYSGGDIGAPKRLLESPESYVYMNANLLVLDRPGVYTVSPIKTINQNNSKLNIALTITTTSVTFYVNGVSIGTFAHAAANFICSNLTIHSASAARIINGDYYYSIAYNTILSATEIAQLTSELEAMPDQRVRSKAVDYDGTKTISFKGELGAIANETTISSGFLENTGAQILSGSFKLVTEKNSGRIEKVIQCVTNGSLYFPQMSSSVSGVSRCIDGTIITTDLATARTIPLTAGQELVYASEDESRSLYQEV